MSGKPERAHAEDLRPAKPPGGLSNLLTPPAVAQAVGLSASGEPGARTVARVADACAMAGNSRSFPGAPERL